MDVTTLIDPLNSAQREAVTHTDNHLLVLAGAGSGKTRVLVHRIAWLVRVEGISPHAILAVTFTNKSAREMRERIHNTLGMSPQGMWVGTFHGLAHRLLKAHWHDAGLPENFQILDSDDQLRLMKRVYNTLGIDDGRWPVRQAQWFINAQKDEGLRARHIERSGDPFTTTMVQVYTAYEEACERGGMVDFAELLLRAHELWLNKPELLAHYQRRFAHILVDEFQDTNAIQYAWLRMLAGSSAMVTAVGDDDQSIYGWRGARIENIQNFTSHFADAKVVRLEQNYRSSAIILKAANAMIARNSERLGKNLWTEAADGELVSLYSAFNEHDEARFIAERILDWVAKGNLRNDCAILYRSNAQSRVLEEALLRERIPYRIYGGQRFYERLEIRNALAYLRLVVNPRDDAAFERVINTPTRGIGDRTLEMLRHLAREENLPLWDALTLALPDLPGRAANALKGFAELIVGLTNTITELPIHEQVDHVLSHTGLLEFHRKEKGERGQTRVDNLEELVSATRSYEPPDRDLPALPQFLAEAALDAGDQQADSHEDAVQLMTLHSAKGLEFPLVFIAGMEENLFPHKMSADDPNRLEEERRLAYVGITRAMQKLYLTFAESRQLHGSESWNGVSRFVRDIPSELVEEVRLGNTVARPTSYASSGTVKLREDGEGTGLRLGQRVMHKTFGEGVVLNVEGNGAQARVQVNFVGPGSKWLVLQYANLEAL
ncbi:MAG: DNA-dependent helicase II [Gammaproteobacteria bacterium BRH_c0]|nr:MAG: DNA-dependent helicase II [Gammaproteobacteria bacterium BRH_c0]